MAGCLGVQGVLAALLVRPLPHLPSSLEKWSGRFTGLPPDHPLPPSHAAVGLGKSLFPLFARSLDLDPDFFDDKVRTGVPADYSTGSLDYVGRSVTRRKTRRETRLR